MKPFDIEQPSLRVFLPSPDLATGCAVVTCPGGGYTGLAYNHEGYDWAPYFNKHGIALIVLISFKVSRKDAVRVACIGNSITHGTGTKK